MIVDGLDSKGEYKITYEWYEWPMQEEAQWAQDNWPPIRTEEEDFTY